MKTDARADLGVREILGRGVILSGGLCPGLIFTAIAPILSSMAAALGGSIGAVWVAQLMMTLPDVGMIIGSPTAGWLIERWGPRLLLMVSLALFGLTGSAGLYISDPQWLLATRLLLGLAGAGVGTSTIALIGSRFEGDQRTRMLGYLMGVGAITGAIATLLSGKIAAVGGWRAPFSLYGIAFVLLVVAVPCIPTSGEHTQVQRVKGHWREEVKSLVALYPLYAWLIGLYVAAYMPSVQLSFLLAANGLTNPLVQSWIIAPNGVASGIGGVVCGFLRPKIRAKWTFVLMVGLMGMGNVLMALGHDPIDLGLGSALCGGGSGVMFTHLSSLIVERAPLHVRGRAIGLFYTFMLVGSFINPLVITPIRLAIGIHGAFLTVGILLGTVVVIATLQRSQSRVASQLFQ